MTTPCACHSVHVILCMSSFTGPSFVGPVKDLAPPTKTLRSSKPSLQDDKPPSLSSWNPAGFAPLFCHPVHVILNGPSFVGPVKDLAPPTKTLRSTPSLQGDKPASLSSWNPAGFAPLFSHPVHVILNGPSFVGPVKDLATPTKTLRSSKPSLQDDKPASLSSWNPEALRPYSVILCMLS